MTATTPKASRLKKALTYKSFIWQKPLKRQPTSLKSVYQLLAETWAFFKNHWYRFSLLVGVVLILGWLLFLDSNASIDLQQIQTNLHQQFGLVWQDKINTTFKLLSPLWESFQQQIIGAMAWFLILFFITSSALWWLIRGLQDASQPVRRVRDAFYFGPAQIVPLTLLIILLFLQILPALIIADFGADLRHHQILQTNWEQALAVVAILVIFSLSLYWLVGGLFSLIIVSLPNVRPWEAWQTSLDLTHLKRWPIIKHLLALLTLYIILACVLALPILWLIPQWADYGFWLINLYLLVFGHIYWFLLYQNLLSVKTTAKS